ncbi:MAG: Lcl C-terminal domain-containing protein, partial [Planctomycetota bacterium]
DFYGQDAHYAGPQPSYQDNGDGTITDLVTGLMWQKTPDLVNQSTFVEAAINGLTLDLAGYTDWRMPTLKELYSLIDFRGHIRQTVEASTPYIDTNYFDFAYGNVNAGDRIIDAQYWSLTLYVGTTMNDAATVFGVNFADGRIKGYPRDMSPRGVPTHFVRYVRGNPAYGRNNFVDNGDGTVTDLATNLMWQQADSGVGYNWRQALSYAESLDLAGYDDWRLPNAKELQSIVDYMRAPDAQNPTQVGPAIDPIFQITNIGTPQDPDYPYFWSSTTHLDGPHNWAVYVAFGKAWGYMEQPPGSGNRNLLNVHGAGAQRSDPKDGDPANWPNGNGPQGDVVRIFNYVRCVRDALPASCAQY